MHQDDLNMSCRFSIFEKRNLLCTRYQAGGDLFTLRPEMFDKFHQSKYKVLLYVPKWSHLLLNRSNVKLNSICKYLNGLI